MNQTVKTELDKIVSTLAETGIVTKIILFGSYAKGEETLNSDIDLCVLTPINPQSNVQLIADFRQLVWDINTTPLDLLAYNQDHFYFHAKRPTSLEYEIAETGVSQYVHR
ncbi:MAG: nucleotidyltransferase domain-containing protein [Chitinispirillales bacterium]|jgi:predicted nucleotidyltransferase|nr:nucleotidyltransferase domain-containing protein [Chitinispirillales bacterium]